MNIYCPKLPSYLNTVPSPTTMTLHFLTFILLMASSATSLNTDGALLLSFKYSTLSDPLSALQSWNYADETPCSWNGVTCTPLGLPGTPDMFRVTSLVLPKSQLLGSIPPDLGYIQNLRHLDLSNNFLNGSLPDSFFNATELQVISLPGNEISGHLPESVGRLRGLRLLNLSDNALDGEVPRSLTGLPNLTVVSLRGNYFSGKVPTGLDSIEVLDLSSNLFNGSLPVDFRGGNLRYLNLSFNKLSGSISERFAEKIPNNATIDLSFNNLTGAIPESVSLLNQKTESFRGNLDLCGKPLRNLCSIPSTLSNPPLNASSTTSPAIAVIPKPTMETNPSTATSSTSSGPQNSSQNRAQSGLKAGTIAGIAAADFAGISILALIILYVYKLKKKKSRDHIDHHPPKTMISKAETEPKKPTTAWYCLTTKGEEETSDATTTSDSDRDEQQQRKNHNQTGVVTAAATQKGGKVVMVDGETELEMETLLKASAYVLGSRGLGGIVYKAVLADGTAFAVRRIGDGGLERLRDFETQVRLIAKLRHPNVVGIRGFCWGEEEKLVIYDYVPNGSLASSGGHRKPTSSPCHLSLQTRLKIARGVARGLAFIHDKKQVHGNIKPTNILLTLDMEPLISDFGLHRLFIPGHCQFGSQRSTSTSQDHPTATPYATMSSSSNMLSPYQAPESLKNLKPNPKWDVYSFGVVLIELLTGRVFSERELGHWAGPVGSEDKNRVLRLADVAIRAEVDGKEEAMVACLKLGFSCASFVPQKRPSMREVVQVLEKIPSSN